MTDQLTLDGMAPRHVAKAPTLVGFASPEHLDLLLDTLVEHYGFDAVETAVGRIKVAMSGPLPQVGERADDQRTSKGKRSSDVRRFSGKSYAGRLLARFSAAREGLTDAEATDLVLRLGPIASVSQWEGCRRRCSDLREAGFLQDSGVERGEPPRVVWVITPQGRAAFQNIVNTGWSRS